MSRRLLVNLRPVKAITMGSAAGKLLNREGVIGKVCAVFGRTVNVLTKEGELLTLATKDIQKSPTNILLDLDPNTCMSTFGVKAGSSVMKLGPFIQICKSKMLISLDKATLWKARKPVKTNLAIESIMRNCDAARDIGRKGGKQEGLSDLLEHLNALAEGETIVPQELNLYSRNALSPITTLVKAVLSRDLGGVHTSANSLIGLGPGLTPSCDDMLVGFMSSLLLVTEALGGDVDYAREVNQTIVSFLDRQTTLVSQKLLEYAALGEVPELTYNVVEAIATGTEKQVKKTTTKLLAVGHSSGTDTLLGIVLGFDVSMNMAAYEAY